jgi:hypothetical protein
LTRLHFLFLPSLGIPSMLSSTTLRKLHLYLWGKAAIRECRRRHKHTTTAYIIHPGSWIAQPTELRRPYSCVKNHREMPPLFQRTSTRVLLTSFLSSFIEIRIKFIFIA